MHIAHRLPGFGINVLQIGAHHRRFQVIGQQSADLPGAGGIAANLLQVFRRRRILRRHHQVADVAFLGDFDIAHIGCEQRSHARAADAGDVEHVVRDLLQGLQELGVVDIAFALPVHAHQQPVGPGESPAEVQEVEHIGMSHRDLFVKPRIQPDMGGAVPQAEGNQQEKTEQAFTARH